MRKDLRDQTLKAAKQIGLHCGAADIIIKGKKNYFLELNSAPSIDTNTLERFYRDGINKLVINPRP
jgi:glutathione synthase/RimK-type ligase-like ATP-grasp enzyme